MNMKYIATIQFYNPQDNSLPVEKISLELITPQTTMQHIKTLFIDKINKEGVDKILSSDYTSFKFLEIIELVNEEK